jgi:hypothetical protein
MALSAVFNISLEFAAGTSESATFNSCDAWVSSVTFAHNETTNQYYPLANNGVAYNSTTGIAPVLTVSGKREVGDASQEAILGLQYNLGSGRKGQLKFSVPTSVGTGGALTSTTYKVPVNVQNITSFGGEGNADSDFSCEFAFDGTPTVVS